MRKAILTILASTLAALVAGAVGIVAGVPLVSLDIAKMIGGVWLITFLLLLSLVARNAPRHESAWSGGNGGDR